MEITNIINVNDSYEVKLYQDYLNNCIDVFTKKGKELEDLMEPPKILGKKVAKNPISEYINRQITINDKFGYILMSNKNVFRKAFPNGKYNILFESNFDNISENNKIFQKKNILIEIDEIFIKKYLSSICQKYSNKNIVKFGISLTNEQKNILEELYKEFKQKLKENIKNNDKKKELFEYYNKNFINIKNGITRICSDNQNNSNNQNINKLLMVANNNKIYDQEILVKFINIKNLKNILKEKNIQNIANPFYYNEELIDLIKTLLFDVNINNNKIKRGEMDNILELKIYNSIKKILLKLLKIIEEKPNNEQILIYNYLISKRVIIGEEITKNFTNQVSNLTKSAFNYWQKLVNIELIKLEKLNKKIINKKNINKINKNTRKIQLEKNIELNYKKSIENLTYNKSLYKELFKKIYDCSNKEFKQLLNNEILKFKNSNQYQKRFQLFIDMFLINNQYLKRKSKTGYFYTNSYNQTNTKEKSNNFENIYKDPFKKNDKEILQSYIEIEEKKRDKSYSKSRCRHQRNIAILKFIKKYKEHLESNMKGERFLLYGKMDRQYNNKKSIIRNNDSNNNNDTNNNNNGSINLNKVRGLLY
jgi:hypothetical protein